jgi:hypothetical protein
MRYESYGCRTTDVAVCLTSLNGAGGLKSQEWTNLGTITVVKLRTSQFSGQAAKL